MRVALAREWKGEHRRLLLSAALTAPRLRTLLHGSRWVLDRPPALLFEDIGSVLKRGAKVCQRKLVNEPLMSPVMEFVVNLGREGATPIKRGFRS